MSRATDRTRLRLLSVAVVLHALFPIAAAPAGPQIDPGLAEALDSNPDGRATAIVILKADAHPPDGLPLRPEEARARRRRVLDRLDAREFTIRHEFQNIPAFTGRLNAAGLARLASDPDVARIGPDEPVHALLNSSVPFIGANVVQSLGYRGQGMTVAVVDTGIDTDHPDLSDDIAPGAWHFLGGGSNQGPGAEDDNGHGTGVAGIITSKGVVAPGGVAPDADVLAVKVLGGDGGGFLSDTARAIDYIVSVRGNYAHLCAINVSLGSFSTYGECPCNHVSASAMLMAASIEAARNVGIPTFVAVLNDGLCGAMTSPACVEKAIAVAHIYDPSSGSLCGEIPVPDLIPCEANRSECNALAAPGVSITTTLIGGGAFTGTGSSFAAPHATALAALMCQKDALDCDPLGVENLIQIMKESGRPTDDPCGIPPLPIRIDAPAALSYVSLRGDLNGDGIISPSDVPFMVDALLGVALPRPQFGSADTNCDGLVNSLDLAPFLDRMIPWPP